MGQHLRRDFVARMSGAISGAIAYADTVFPDVAPLIRATGWKRYSHFASQHEKSRRGFAPPAAVVVQREFFRPPSWPWPHGSRSRPSKAATGNHRARARVP